MLWNNLWVRWIEILLAKANELQHFHNVGEQNAIQLCAFGELAFPLINECDGNVRVVAGIYTVQLCHLVWQQNGQTQLDTVKRPGLANHIHLLIQQSKTHLIRMHLRIETCFVLKHTLVGLHLQSNVISQRGNYLA